MSDGNKISVHLRLDSEIVSLVKTEAEKKGLPYQTLINSILKQYLTGDLVEKKSVDMLKDFISRKDGAA